MSAVVYCNQFGVSKFFRMAAQRDGWPEELGGVVAGYYIDGDEGPREYKVVLEDQQFDETWCLGVTVLHNPRAVHPLSPGALRCTCEYRSRAGYIDSVAARISSIDCFMNVYQRRPTGT